MIDRRKLEVLAKYTSNRNMPFNAEELQLVFALLNIYQEITEIEETKLIHYHDVIRAAVADQNRSMTGICGELLRIQAHKSDIDAYKYVLENLTEVKSPFMLDI